MIASALLLLYIFSPLLIAGALVFIGVRFRRKPESGYRITGMALFLVAAVSVAIFVQLASLAQNDPWGFSWFGIPITAVIRMAIAFGVIWPLFVISALIGRKIRWPYLLLALPLLFISSYTIMNFAQNKSMLNRSYKAEFTRDEIRELLQRQKQLSEKRQHDHWIYDTLKNIVKNEKVVAEVLAEYVEYGVEFAYEDIVRHPNVTPELIDKIADNCSEGLYPKISMNGKTPAKTLDQMYRKAKNFYTRGWIVNNPNAPDSIVTDFVNKALHETDKKNSYWAVEGVRSISPSLLEKLSNDSDDLMRLAVASNYYTPIPIIHKLQKDSNELVKYRANENLRLRDYVRKDIEKRYGVAPRKNKNK